MTSATAAGHINISAAGDLTFASADAWTRVDVDYLPAVMDTVTLTLPVVTSDIALPTSVTAIGAVMLLRAVLTVGTVTGEGKVIAPGSRSSTTLQCNLNLAKDTVQFVSADAVTQATITLGLVPGTNLDTLLKASEGVLT
jgi:hypothetical protein